MQKQRFDCADCLDHAGSIPSVVVADGSIWEISDSVNTHEGETNMKTQRTLVALTVINLALLAYQVVPSSPAEAQTSVTMLRGSGIEIFDNQGRLRAQLIIEPADESVKMPNGESYPDTVIFRLKTPDGKPRVKLTTSMQGSGLGLIGDSDTTQATLKAEGAISSLKLRNNEENEQLIKP